MSQTVYIHGVDPDEQDRLAKLGGLTNEAFLRFLERRPQDAILDVGCGLGVLTRRLAQLSGDGGEVWGVEASSEQLERGERLASADSHADVPSPRFLQGDAHALPFENDRFDVVFCRYLLEHVADPVQVLREMRRVLKPGGLLFAQENNILINDFDPDCPTFDIVWERFAQLQRILGGDALIGKKLRRLLRQAGFSRVELSIQPEVHSHGMPTFRPWVENLINNFQPVEAELAARGLATTDQTRQAAAELRALIDNEDGSAYFYWNRAKAVK